MPSERAIPSKLNNGRSRTPYERPAQPSTPKINNRATAVSAPMRHGSNRQATPSSIFSRVKGFLTPRNWGKRESDHYNSDNDVTMDEDHSRDHSSDRIFSFPPPSIPRPNLDRFNQYEQSHSKRGSPLATPTANNPAGYSSSSFTDASSPNQRLADFFKSKGDAQLTDIEAEGVLSLIRQASARNESLVEFRNESLFDKVSEHSDSVTSDSTPIKGTNSSPRVSVTAMSPYSPLYSQRKANTETQTASSTHRVNTPTTLHFNSIPTPYRPSSRSSINRSRSSSVVADSKTRSPQPEEAKQPEVMDKTETKKPLSQTASALLSLLDTNEPEKKKQDVPTEVQPFINPYASTPRSSPKPKPRKSLVANHTTPKKVSAVAELERTKPSGSTKSYKPARSSNLRQSTIPSPDSKYQENVIRQEEGVASFAFQSPKAQGSFKSAPSFTFSSPAKSSSHIVSPNKPLVAATPVENTPSMRIADKAGSHSGFGNPPISSLFKPATPHDANQANATDVEPSASRPNNSNSIPALSFAQPSQPVATKAEISNARGALFTSEPVHKDVSENLPSSAKASANTEIHPFSFEFPSIDVSSPSVNVDRAEVERLKRDIFSF